jgi:tetratricopeptide (TPR) repeat protein
MKVFGIFLWILLFFFSCQGPTKNPTSDPYSLETLTFLEEVLLDVWESTDSREEALSRLRYVCRNNDTEDGFLCYTWGLIEYKRGNYNESYTAFKKALEKSPSDTLYKNLLRLSAEKSGNLSDLEQTQDDGKTMALYSQTVTFCQSESQREKMYPAFLTLSKEGHITKDMLKKGVFSQCFLKLDESQKAEILTYTKSSKLNYADRLVADKVKSDPFSKVWDTSFYHKGQDPKEGIFYSHPISEAWRKLRSAAKSGNEGQARESLKQFQNEIQLAKKKGKTEANLATALERSAKLLLEQDPVYTKVSFLAKEL